MSNKRTRKSRRSSTSQQGSGRVGASGQLSFERLEPRQLLATFTINSASDLPVDLTDNIVTLRDAIQAANNDVAAAPGGVVGSGADTISFDASVFATPQTIQLNSQFPTISRALTINGPGQNLLTLDAGNGADNTFATGDGFRIFNIDDGTSGRIDVTLGGLTLTGGDTANGLDGADGASGEDGTSGADGGAIRSLETLILNASTISGNATGDGGIGGVGVVGRRYGYAGVGGNGGDGGRGGGVYSGGVLIISSTTISGNATGFGGFGGVGGEGVEDGYGGGGGGAGGLGGHGAGIYSGNGPVTTLGSTITGNTAGAGGGGGSGSRGVGGAGVGGRGGRGGDGGGGGGIHSVDGALTIVSSTITDNVTGFGGHGGEGSESGQSGLGGGDGGHGGVGGHGGGIDGGNGPVTIYNSSISGNTNGDGGDGGYGLGRYAGYGGFGGHGGGIYSIAGAIKIYSSAISGNASGDGGDGGDGGYGSGGDGGNGGGGGGIDSGDGSLTISGSTISSNTTGDGGFGGYAEFGFGGAHGFGGGGGGIFNDSGALILTNSTVGGNSTAGNYANGGGIFNNSGAVTLSSSTVGGNSTAGRGADGGGIYSGSGSVSLTNSTVSGNIAIGSGSFGGGISNRSGVISLANSTVIGNEGWVGGGIFQFNSSLNPSLVIANSIVAGNTDNGTAPDLRPDTGSTLTINHSLIGVADNIVQTIVGNVGNQTGTAALPLDPLLGPLADNGGPTLTHALLSTSPAINAGDPTASPDNGNTPQFDQRGQSRVQVGRLDIGAFESPFEAPTVLLGDVNKNGVVNFLDISPFIVVLSNGGFQAEADINQDGSVNFLDISPFTGVLSGNSQLSVSDLITASLDLSGQTSDGISVELAAAPFSPPLPLVDAALTELSESTSKPVRQTGDGITVQLEATPPSPTLLRKDVTDAQLSETVSEPSPLAYIGGSHGQDGSDSRNLPNPIPAWNGEQIPMHLPSKTSRFVHQVKSSDFCGRVFSSLDASEQPIVVTRSAKLFDAHPEILGELLDFEWETTDDLETLDSRVRPKIGS